MGEGSIPSLCAINAASSNGRIFDFESKDVGSTPTAASKNLIKERLTKWAAVIKVSLLMEE